MLGYDEVLEIVTNLSNLSKVWSPKYIAEDSQKGFQQPWLKRLSENPDEEIISQLTNLDGYLGMITNCKGYNKLLPGLKAHDTETTAL